jgi:hypothetical protein
MDQTIPPAFAADDVLEAIASSRRRTVIRRLAGSDDAVRSIEDLAADVAARGDPAGRQDVETVLHHSDLPKLADAGIVEYDPGPGTVRYRPDDDVEALLGFVGERFE